MLAEKRSARGERSSCIRNLVSTVAQRSSSIRTDAVPLQFATQCQGPKARFIPAWIPRAEGPFDTSLGRSPRVHFATKQRAESPIYSSTDFWLRRLASPYFASSLNIFSAKKFSTFAWSRSISKNAFFSSCDRPSCSSWRMCCCTTGSEISRCPAGSRSSSL